MGNQGHGSGGGFAAQIGNAKFEFRSISFDDQKVTGGQIAEAVGAHPIENFVILAQLPSFELETLRPQETTDLSKVSRFFVIQGDSTDRFFVDGLSLEWPKKTLTGAAIKTLVGKDGENVELLQEEEDAPDKIIADSDEVNIGARGVEKFKTRKIGVTIFVEGMPHPWNKPKITYAEVVTLEFPDYPQHPEILYSVTYTKGPNKKPEGDLVKGDTVHVKDGMSFHVSPTGES
ncbi:MAG: multiubiquitin domain-containing protein [Alphaproteobacteria bacterium]